MELRSPDGASRYCSKIAILPRGSVEDLKNEDFWSLDCHDIQSPVTLPSFTDRNRLKSRGSSTGSWLKYNKMILRSFFRLNVVSMKNKSSALNTLRQDAERRGMCVNIDDHTKNVFWG